MAKKKKEKSRIYGNNIRQILKAKGMSATELSDLTGINCSHISKIMSGERGCISLPIAFEIAAALKTQIEKVFIHKGPTYVPRTKKKKKDSGL